MKNTHLRFYEKEEDAYSAMRRHNQSLKSLKHRASYIRVMIDGPEDNFAVVDIDTALEMQVPYEWAA